MAGDLHAQILPVSQDKPRKVPLWRKALATFGPGLMVCLADTDGGGLVTAAQSGAEWRYKLVGLQLALMPVLFCAQELTVRIGLLRGKGLVAVLRHDLGAGVAWFVAISLLICCLGAVLSEMSMIMDVMVWWGVDIVTCNTVVSLALLALALTGSYEIPEKVGLAMGICQLAFFATMYIAGPSMDDMVADLQKFPVGDGDFSSIVTANIGAVIMPWMLAYQQSSMVRKGLSETADPDTFFLQRLDTGFGCFLTQGVMISMIVSVGAVLPEHSKVETVNDLIAIFTPTLGSKTLATIVLTFGINGACMVAAIVVSMCAAWTMEEAMGQDDQKNDIETKCSCDGVVQALKRRPAFYAAYIGILVFSFVGCVAFRDVVVQLNIYIESLNGLLMPPVVFSLWYLASYNLPEEHKLKGVFKWLLFTVFLVCSVFCVYSVVVG